MTEVNKVVVADAVAIRGRRDSVTQCRNTFFFSLFFFFFFSFSLSLLLSELARSAFLHHLASFSPLNRGRDCFLHSSAVRVSDPLVAGLCCAEASRLRGLARLSLVLGRVSSFRPL